MIIRVEDLHYAFANFVVHLRETTAVADAKVQGIDSRVSVLDDRVSNIEETGTGEASEHLLAHIEAPEPHPAYGRDIPDLTVLFNNLIT